jgi:hypothetical protein
MSNDISVFLIYAYTIFHGHVKSYLFIYFYTYTVLHDLK